MHLFELIEMGQFRVGDLRLLEDQRTRRIQSESRNQIAIVRLLRLNQNGFDRIGRPNEQRDVVDLVVGADAAGLQVFRQQNSPQIGRRREDEERYEQTAEDPSRQNPADLSNVAAAMKAFPRLGTDATGSRNELADRHADADQRMPTPTAAMMMAVMSAAPTSPFSQRRVARVLRSTRCDGGRDCQQLDESPAVHQTCLPL